MLGGWGSNRRPWRKVCLRSDCRGPGSAPEPYAPVWDYLYLLRTVEQWCVGDAYRYTIQPIYDNLTDSVTCHIRRRRPSTPILFDLFYFVEVAARGFRSPVVRRRVLADAASHDGRRGSVVADYLNVEFDVGVDLADEFLLRAGGVATARAPGGDRTVVGTVWNLNGGGVSSTRRRFRVHEIAKSSAFVVSVRPGRPFDVSTARWRRRSVGAADAGAASCDMSPSKFLPDNDDDDDYRTERDPRHLQAVKAVIQGKHERDRMFRYYIMSAESPPHFRFTIPGECRSHIDESTVYHFTL